MSSESPAANASETGRRMLNKVPEITIYFWVIKILCTTVGETAADYLNTSLGLGLNGTTVVMTGLLVVGLIVQFWTKRYVPTVYWIAVVLISVVGTLITDKITDDLKVPLEVTTFVFGVALAITFGLWYHQEKTLSIRTIYTQRREGFYWATILWTFALGTAAGDLGLETLGDYMPKNKALLLSAVFFVLVIAAAAVAHLAFKVNSVLAFWVAYVFTRPLGANLGDLFSLPPADGGLGLGPKVTSLLFLGAILVSIIYLSLTKKDAIPDPHFIVETQAEHAQHEGRE
jgi:uncharacterized membrane-anchored protein